LNGRFGIHAHPDWAIKASDAPRPLGWGSERTGQRPVLLLYVLEVIEETDSISIEAEVMPDHVHLLIDVDPQFSVHRVVKAIKGRSSRLLRSEFRWLR
jgi:hypothetical protein